MKSIVEKNSKKDKKWFKFNYNKQCIYKTKHKFHLKRHINSVHKKIKKFKCFWSEYKEIFGNRSFSYRHQLIHSNEKNYVCVWPQCGQRFKRIHDLTEHKLIHSSIKKFKCNFNGCNKTFRYSGHSFWRTTIYL
jgi:uncharacterized Zn-finger protein